jgi:tRNA modification GTPase
MFLSHDEQIIIAQCTPSGPGALALLRITGVGAAAFVDQFCSLTSGALLAELPTHTIHYGTVIDNEGSIVDRVLFLLMQGPRTFTGQETVEITCHNNQFIIEEIIHTAITYGARLAEPGEFSKRAVLAGKIDIAQAEAIVEVIHAHTQKGIQLAMEQLAGSLSHHITSLYNELMTALAYCQGSFEFVEEEDMEFGTFIREKVAHILRAIESLNGNNARSKQIRQGVRIALIGAVNAGKSSLFNAIIGTNRAIVSPTAGTTRDVIEAGIYQNGVCWTLIDTAGIRETNEQIEQEGINRSLHEAKTADVILLAIDSTRSLTTLEQKTYEQLYKDFQHKIIIVHTKNKANSIPAHFDIDTNAIQLCTTIEDRGTINVLTDTLRSYVQTAFFSTTSSFLLSKRQHQLLSVLQRHLKDTMEILNKDHIAYELVACHLSDALANVAELTGKSISEEAMNRVFEQFCVGK